MVARLVATAAALLAIGSPAAYALPGPSGAGDASVAQYGYPSETPPPVVTIDTPPPSGEVAGEVISSDERPETGVVGDGTTVVREDTATGTAVERTVRREQASSSPAPAGELPFTGFDVLVAVLAGCALIVAGGAARRLSRPQPAR